MLHPLRTPQTDFRLGTFLALLAGAVNAGGFLAIGQYTSHLTGMVATSADALVLHQWPLMALAVLGITAFMAGTILAALFVNWGGRHRPHHRYALPLALEGLLIITFGLYGLFMPAGWQFPVCGILLLGLLMGLHNGMGGLITNLRTTHHTGTLTDIGTELGHLLYNYLPRRRTTPAKPLPQPNLHRLKTNATMILAFVLGSFSGAVGFQFVGMAFALPIGILLLALSLPVLARSPSGPASS